MESDGRAHHDCEAWIDGEMARYAFGMDRIVFSWPLPLDSRNIIFDKFEREAVKHL